VPGPGLERTYACAELLRVVTGGGEFVDHRVRPAPASMRHAALDNHGSSPGRRWLSPT
jgi:hypothetical protein